MKTRRAQRSGRRATNSQGRSEDQSSAENLATGSSITIFQTLTEP